MKKTILRRKGLSILLALALIVSLSPVQTVTTEAVAPTQFTITETGIRADSVSNEEGYGSLKRNPPEDWTTPPTYSLIDANGNFVFEYGEFPCQIYLYDGVFVNGIVTGINDWGEAEGVYSLFDLSGQQIIENTYDYLNFYNGYGVGITSPTEDTEEKRELINASGEVVLTLPDGFNVHISGGGGDFMFEQRYWGTGYLGNVGGYGENLLWVYTATGIQENIDEATGITDQLPVPQDWLQMAWYGGPYCGYIDLEGNVVIPLQYYSVNPFCEGLAAVQEYVAPSIPFDEWEYGIDLGGEWKYIRPDGSEAFPGTFTYASNFFSGYACVANDAGLYGFIDNSGNTVIPMEYDNAFAGGDGQYFAVGKRVDGVMQYGLVDANNQIVLPIEYDDISTFRNGVAYGIQDGEVYIIKATGEQNENILASGVCGDDLTWVLDRDGVLTISGTGDMWDFEGYWAQPWYANSADIKALVLEAGITSIGDYAFVECYFLSKLTIPDSVTRIGDYALANVDLTDIYIPKNVSDIGEGAFNAYYLMVDGTYPVVTGSNLESITVSQENPYFVSVDGVLFSRDMSRLIRYPNLKDDTAYVVPEQVATIDPGAFYNAQLTEIKLPDNLTEIGSYVFYNAALTKVHLPKNLKTIGVAAFKGNCFSEIEIPACVTEIQGAAFYRCYNLTDIYFAGDAPTIGGWNNVFQMVTATAYYPADNATWTADVMQDYGGTITWVPYEVVHEHSYTAVVTEPTCTEAGYTTYTCECGDSYTEEIPALGHGYVDGVCRHCGEAEFEPGDVNGDGRVNARDARVLLRAIAGLDDELPDPAVADLNKDGRVNARDARALLRSIAGLD